MKTFYLCILLWTSGCLLVSGQTVRVFDNERICFDPNLYQKNYIYTDSNKIIHLTNGRIILKKIALPFHEQNLQMETHGIRPARVLLFHIILKFI